MKTIKKLNKSATSPQIIEWYTLSWKKINNYVKRLRHRIFRSEQLGQKRKVRKLQRLMIRSKANLLLSIKRITQINKGRRTPGIDGYVIIELRKVVSIMQRNVYAEEYKKEIIRLVTNVTRDVGIT